VIAAEQENIIDGYYRIRGMREGKTVSIVFEKIQSLTGRLMRILSGGIERYATENAKYAQNSSDYIASHVTTAPLNLQNDDEKRN